MIIPIVTSTDDGYLPGCIALYNSYLKNSKDGFSFHVLAYGDESLKEKLHAAGIENVYLNAAVGAERIPKSVKYDWYRHEIESSAMYARLIIPDLFPDVPYSIYVDADAIILKSLKGLLVNMSDYPCGGTQSWSTMVADVPDAGLTERGIMTSFLVFNHKAWKEKDVYVKCIELMNTSKLHFKTVVQGVLQMVIRQDYYMYPEFHQVQASHDTTIDRIKDAYILHFVGYNPWEKIPQELLDRKPVRRFTLDIWRKYA